MPGLADVSYPRFTKVSEYGRIIS